MPPPPKSAGFVKISRVLSSNDLIEFTPRDERGFPIVPKTQENTEVPNTKTSARTKQASSKNNTARSSTGGATSRSRRPLSALSLRQVVEDSRKTGGKGAQAQKSASSKNLREEKPRDWQEWVIKSRNTWMREARPNVGNVVNLRGAGGAGRPMANQQNASHPRVPKLW